MTTKNADTLSPAFQQVSSVIGVMLALFTLLQALLPTGLVQPIGTLGAGFILTLALVLANRWAWNTAGLTWAGTSIFLIIVHLVVSQPATLTGYAVKDDGTPMTGLSLVITNSNGVNQNTVTDQDGKFEVQGVPEGRYTITVKGKLVYSGVISSGWQRILEPQINTGTHPIQVISLQTPPSIAPPAIPNPTATSTVTASNTPTTVVTATPTTKPTATPTPTDVPPALMLYEGNFDAGFISGWAIADANPPVVVDDGTGNKVLRIASGTFERNVTRSDYALEFDYMIPKPSSNGHLDIAVRRSGAVFCPGYLLHVEPNIDQFYKASGSCGSMIDFGATGFQSAINTWYKVRIEVKGTSLKVFRNNQIEYSAEDKTYTGTGIGFLGSQMEIFVDNIRVWALS